MLLKEDSISLSLHLFFENNLVYRKRSLFIFSVLSMLLVLFSIPAYAVEDTKGPTVTNYSITPETVEVGDYVTVYAEISDISGVRNDVSVQICSSAGNVAGGTLRRISGDQFDGAYQGTYQIPSGYSAGQWYATLYANDVLGNFAGFHTVYFTVNGIVDTKGPTVTNYSITPETVEVGDYVTVYAEISDISGVRNDVSVQICSSAGNVAGGTLRRISGDQFDGAYQGTYQIPSGYSAGQWYATLYANDVLGNFAGFHTVYFTVYDLSDHNIISLPFSIEIISSEAFANTNAEVVIVPENCKEIAPDAFSECKKLKYIINYSNVEIEPLNGVRVINK